VVLRWPLKAAVTSPADELSTLTPYALESVVPVKALRLDGRPCRTVLDTGAVITLGRRGLLVPPPPKANLRIRGVNGAVVAAYGPRRTTFQFGAIAVIWAVFEVDMPEDCLLGADLMVHLKAYVDMGYARFVLRQRGPGQPLPSPMAVRFELLHEVPALYHFDALLCVHTPPPQKKRPFGELGADDADPRGPVAVDQHPDAAAELGVEDLGLFFVLTCHGGVLRIPEPERRPLVPVDA